MRSTSFHFAMRSRARERADLELARIPADGEMGDGRRPRSRPSAPRRWCRSPRCLPGIERGLRLGQRAGLVGLDQHRVARRRRPRHRARAARWSPGSRRRRSARGCPTARGEAASSPPRRPRRAGPRSRRSDSARSSRAASRIMPSVSSSRRSSAERVAAVAAELARRRCRARSRRRSPGMKPARSIARTSMVQRLLVGRERRPPAALVGDAVQRAALAPSARRRRDRPRPSCRAPRRKLDAPRAITMKSWMSTRRPACAPPPKIWISGSGSGPARPSAR